MRNWTASKPISLTFFTVPSWSCISAARQLIYLVFFTVPHSPWILCSAYHSWYVIWLHTEMFHYSTLLYIFSASMSILPYATCNICSPLHTTIPYICMSSIVSYYQILWPSSTVFSYLHFLCDWSLLLFPPRKFSLVFIPWWDLCWGLFSFSSHMWIDWWNSCWATNCMPRYR